MNQSTDNIYAATHSKISDFCFDQKVAEVFPDMISRSVPGYQTILHTLGLLTAKFAKSNSNFYDLGCSLGAASLVLRRHNSAANCQIISVDNSPAMLERCQHNIDSYKGNTPIELRCSNIQDVEIYNASIVVLNFTLQFLQPDERQMVINKIYQGLNAGGMLLISEKIRSEDQLMNELLIELHHEFKRANGYSELEISQKRTALENVMKTDSINCHKQRLQKAGFKHLELWLQNYNFCSFIAVKD